MEWIKEKETLQNLIITKKLSYEEIGRKYGFSGNYIKKVAIKLNIPITARRKINISETFNKNKVTTKICQNCKKEFKCFPYEKRRFCSKNCSNEYKTIQKYKDYLLNPNKYEGQNNMTWVKKHIIKEQNYECAICGCKEIWNNKSLVFILDHIDGHANNNKRDNLRLICPNCDSQLDTYKSKNKNSDRTYYHFNHR